MTELEQIIESSPRLSDNTKKSYRKSVRRFIEFAGPHEPGWTGIQVENWRNKLLAEGRKPQTVNQYLAALRYVSRRRAERHQNPLLDFARYAETLRVMEIDSGKALSFDDGRRFIQACEGEEPIDLRDMAIAVLGFRTGLRRSGMCDIRFDDLKGGTVEVTLKGGRRHTLPIDNEVGPALSDWIDWLKSQKIKSGHVFRSLPKPTLSGFRVGKKLTPDGLYKAMKRRAEKAGIEGFHPHVFRHTCVSWLREHGVEGWRIAQLTGHRHDGTTDPKMIDHYTTNLSDSPISGHIPSLRRH